MTPANWNYPTSVRVGAGRLSELPAACRELGMRAPLLVTDPGLATLPMIREALTLCRDAGLDCGLFSDVKSNPTGANVEAGAEQFRAGGHDGVIAFGGGSVLDAGKATALVANQAAELWDFEDIGDNWTRADADAIAPLVALPTTAGTGSEVGRASVITNEGEQRKVIVFHPRMLPQIVILDPELTTGLPPGLTAATGMDALSHNLEAYCSPFYHPMAEGIAVEGTRLVKAYLPTAVADGGNIEARTQMLVASSMGATAFQRGLGAMHALAHPLGARYDAHHGMLNAELMPYVLSANRPAIEARIGRLARWLELDGDFDGFQRWIVELRGEIGIPHDLRALGVDDSCLESIGKQALADASSATNPVAHDAAAFREICRRALEGTLDD